MVIGGNGVLGAAMCEGLATHGASVVIVGRNEEKGVGVKDRISSMGGEALFLQADATSKDMITGVLENTIAWKSHVDILVNAAGINSNTPFFDIQMEEFDRIVDVNLKSVVIACQVFGSHMCKSSRGGSIINISSVSSGPPLSQVFTYSLTKAAVNNLTQFLAREFAPYHVRVNAVIPGFFPAEQNKKILTEQRMASIMQHTPYKRFGNPEELQGTIVWLASDEASGFVSGALVRVDGGFSAMTI